MTLVYSTYEAKARFSEILRRVREGKTITVAYRGEPVAEIRAIPKKPSTIEERLDTLARNGELIGPSRPRQLLKVGEQRPGALAHFLAERAE